MRTRTVEYFWGNDLSGSEQGAGGVGGLLAVSVDGAFYIPCYDHNGNVVCYVSESESIAAQYVYDPYGNVIEQYGRLSDEFAFRFSTKYYDGESGMISYQRRFYRPDHGRWLNRDPIEESGGENLYAHCGNNAVIQVDPLGLNFKNEFVAAIQILGGLSTVALGGTIGGSLGWTGVGAVAGFGIGALGCDQIVAGLQNLQNAVNGEQITDSTPVKSTYRYMAEKITGNPESGIVTQLDDFYGAAEIVSSCYGGYVAVRAMSKALRLIYVPAQTVKKTVIQDGYLRWSFYLRASYWKLDGKGEAFINSFDLILEGASQIEPDNNSNNPDMGMSQ